MIVVLASGIVLAACGGGSSAGSSTPVASAAEAAMGFLRAAADSNVTRMAELWGTSSGPASKTNQPTDYQRRIVVIQTFLWSDSSKVIGQAAVPGDDNRRTVTVAIWRGGCMKQLPFSMVRTRDGAWLVQDPRLELAGNPARPCDGEPPPGTESSLEDATEARSGVTR
jgi:hypothetical protein